MHIKHVKKLRLVMIKKIKAHTYIPTQTRTPKTHIENYNGLDFKIITRPIKTNPAKTKTCQKKSQLDLQINPNKINKLDTKFMISNT